MTRFGFSLFRKFSSMKRMRRILLISVVATVVILVCLMGMVIASGKHEQAINFETNQEITSEYWEQSAQATLKAHLQKKYLKGTAKNIIFFLGDGMSMPTITATRIYAGQLKGLSGEEMQLPLEKFPFTGFAKTYCVDRQVSDSACTATAYLCGVKNNYNTIGVNGKVKDSDCQAALDPANHVHSLAVLAQKAGKATGFATTTRATDASPAGLYAHTSHRYHESDTDVNTMSNNTVGCRDVATQLVHDETGRNLNVILGGGRQKFFPISERDEYGDPGQRSDGINLIDEWKKNHPNGKYITNREQLKALKTNETSQLLGLFASDHMDYNLDTDHKLQPTLKEMAEAAIDILSKNENGYFLFVEGGRIDDAHHEALAHKALDETLQFNEAIEAVVNRTKREDTLILVTADHSHTLSISGYPHRGNPILEHGHELSEFDHMPYLTLSYANGPGTKSNLKPNGERVDPKTIAYDKDYRHPGTVELLEETHGGEETAVFAWGPHADLFVGLYEQNVIPHLVAYAACLGEGITACDNQI